MQIAGHGSAIYLCLIRKLRRYFLCCCGVDRLEVIALQNNMLDELIALKISDVASQCNVITEVTVHCKDRHLILLLIPYSYGVYVCDIRILLRVMLRGGKYRLQGHAASVFGCMQIRIVNRLLPCRSVRLGHDRCDNIYKLCQARHLDTVRMLNHRDQKQSYNERILKGVWGENYFGDVKIVDVNIRRLRMKVEDEPSHPAHILTVWGYGYRWEE